MAWSWSERARERERFVIKRLRLVARGWWPAALDGGCGGRTAADHRGIRHASRTHYKVI